MRRVSFRDHRPTVSDSIASIPLARLQGIAAEAPLEQIDSVDAADLVFCHLSYIGICKLVGWFPFEPDDLEDWSQVIDVLSKWSVSDAPVGTELDDEIGTRVKDASGTRQEGQVAAEALNRLLQRPTLHQRFDPEIVDASGAREVLEATGGTPHSNELRLLNRRLLEHVVPLLPKVARKAVSFPDGQIAVLVTTQPRYDEIFPFLHTELRLPERTRRILFVRDTAQLEDDDVLRDVLRLTSDQAAAIVHGKTAEIPASVVRLFAPAPSDVLQALLVLSLSYLCATWQTYQPSLSDGALEAARHDIRLDGLLESLGPRASEITEGLAKGESEVQGVHWWSKGLGLSNDPDGLAAAISSFQKSFKKQWCPERFGEVPEAMTRLLGELKAGHPVNSPEQIAQIYCELVRRVLGRRCFLPT